MKVVVVDASQLLEALLAAIEVGLLLALALALRDPPHQFHVILPESLDDVGQTCAAQSLGDPSSLVSPPDSPRYCWGCFSGHSLSK